MSSDGQPATETAARSRRTWSDLGPRIISSAVIIVVIATGLYFGGFVFAALAAIVFGLTYREWERMVTLKPLGTFGAVLIGLLGLSAIAYPLYGPLGTLVPVLAGAVLSAFGERPAITWRIGGLALFAAVIIAVLGMRGTETAGIVAGWYLGIVISCNDTGAYFVGRIIGGEKLAPAISPAKTRSGAIGGFLIGTAAGTVFWMVFTPSAWWIGLLLSALLSIVGQVGDLCESAIKRIFRIKDSSDIIPGHGGLMDRLDSVSFGVIVLFAIGLFRGGIDHVATGFLVW